MKIQVGTAKLESCARLSTHPVYQVLKENRGCKFPTLKPQKKNCVGHFRPLRNMLATFRPWNCRHISIS